VPSPAQPISSRFPRLRPTSPFPHIVQFNIHIRSPSSLLGIRCMRPECILFSAFEIRFKMAEPGMISMGPKQPGMPPRPLPGAPKAGPKQGAPLGARPLPQMAPSSNPTPSPASAQFQPNVRASAVCVIFCPVSLLIVYPFRQLIFHYYLVRILRLTIPRLLRSSPQQHRHSSSAICRRDLYRKALLGQTLCNWQPQ
jgi:hypothetical protein